MEMCPMSRRQCSRRPTSANICNLLAGVSLSPPPSKIDPLASEPGRLLNIRPSTCCDMRKSPCTRSARSLIKLRYTSRSRISMSRLPSIVAKTRMAITERWPIGAAKP